VFPDLEAPLRDERISLRFSSERDIPEILIAHQDDPSMFMRLGHERPPSGAELGRAAERAAADRAAGERAGLAILELGSDDCRGELLIHHVDTEMARAELGLWVAPQVRGRGYARSALGLASGWLFAACGLERLAVLTETDNEPMIRAALAAGFVREGVLRGYTRERGQRVDNLSLSMVRADCEQRP
jgi:ribosomal-protein-alanine N-acetyltransferase